MGETITAAAKKGLVQLLQVIKREKTAFCSKFNIAQSGYDRILLQYVYYITKQNLKKRKSFKKYSN